MTRGLFGSDDIYARMAIESLRERRALSVRCGQPIFHPIGVLIFFARGDLGSQASAPGSARKLQGLPAARTRASALGATS
jgi:hypothetical protein